MYSGTVNLHESAVAGDGMVHNENVRNSGLEVLHDPEISNFQLPLGILYVHANRVQSTQSPKKNDGTSNFCPYFVFVPTQMCAGVQHLVCRDIGHSNITRVMI